ncbi:MAG: BspA family leucine-rich repeat surface protein, partial [Ruminococcus flavefaciens]|nr:BspA family leucine-rich repeat surface protein [Ruminococcus flavefaciens]
MRTTKRKWDMRRALSVLLACAMLFSSVELPVYAAEPDAAVAGTAAKAEEDTEAATEGQQGQPDAGDMEEQPTVAETEEEEKQPDTSETEGEKEQPDASETEGGEEQPDLSETEGGEEQPDLSETEGSEEQPDASETEDGEEQPDASETEGEEQPDASETEEGEAKQDDSIAVDSLEDSEAAKIVESGTINSISWSLDEDGMLTITGSGDYTDGSQTDAAPPWAKDSVREKAMSAVIDVSGMTYAAHLFDGFKDLSSIDLSDFNTSQIVDMNHMFYNCNYLYSLDVSGFDTGKVTDMSYMFAGCSDLKSLDLGNFNTGSVTDMSCMFDDCSYLKSLDISNFNTVSVTNMDSMFYGCSSLASLDLSSFDMAAVLSADGMLDECSMLYYMRTPKNCAPGIGLDTSGSWRDESGTEYTELPAQLDHSIALSKYADAVDSGTINNISWEIDGNGKLTITGTGDYLSAEASIPPWANRADVRIAEVDVSDITSTKNMFRGCTDLFSVDLSKLDTSKVTDMSYMFYCTRNRGALVSLDLSHFDTSNVTNMSNMFSGQERMESLDISHFDTSNVTNMSNMFYCAEFGGLKSLDVSSFNTSNVTNMSGMFGGQSELRSLDLHNFDTSKVKNMSGMCWCCSSLWDLDISSFDTSEVTDMSAMFYNTSGIDLDLKNFDTSKVEDMVEMFDGWYFGTLNLSSFDLSNVDEGGVFNLDGNDVLSTIFTPKNCMESITLPISADTDKWYDKDGNVYTELPKALDYSIVLCKNKYPEESETVSLSGITVEDKVYDGKAAVYTGTPVLTDASDNVVSDISAEAYYTGTLADGSAYEKSADAPIQAGEYTLLFELTGTDAARYELQNASYDFTISRKEATITAEAVEIAIGGQLPAVSELKYTVEGLLENDALVTEPSMKYSADTIETAMAGAYEIIPYDADAGNNYSIQYVNGKLIVGYDPAGEEIVYSGKVNDISWKLNKNGKLTIEGTGDYTDGGENILPPWIDGWNSYGVQYGTTSAEVKVTGMTCADSMFYGCKNLKSVDLSGFDTSAVTNMHCMFQDCSSLESLDLSSMDTSSVTHMGGMFSGCSSLRELDLSHFNTYNVTYMGAMFSDCSSLQSIKLGNFYTGKVTGMRGMFRNCSSLKNLDVSGFNTSQSTDLEEMFLNCSSLESLDLSNFVFRLGYGGTWDGLQYKFLGGCGGLRSIRTPRRGIGTDVHLPTPDDGSQWYDENGGRYGTLPRSVVGGNKSITLTAKKFNSGVDHNISWEIDENGKLTISGSGNYNDGYNNFLMTQTANGPSVPVWANRSDVITAEVHVTGMTSTSNMFTGCKNLRSVDLSGLATGGVRSMDSMFSGCSSLESLDLSSLDTSNVSSMGSMFSDCSSLRSLDLSSFDTSSVAGMRNMFSGCSSLQSINLSSFDTGIVSSMENMFSGCSSLESLDLSNFNTENVTNMGEMFSGCTGLQRLNVSSFATGNVTKVYGMFQNCSSLQSLDLSGFDMSKVLSVPGFFLDECDSLSYIRTPVMVNYGEYDWLPGGGIWHDSAMKEYTGLPSGLSESITLYKDPADGTAKQYVSVTGVSMANKTYDGKGNPYTGTAVLTDVSGSPVPNVTLTAVYAGTLADGSVYENTAEAPSQAGSYTLSFVMDDDHAAQYTLVESTYQFAINQREVTITAPSYAIELGGQAPDLAGSSDYVVEGLVDGESLFKNPSLQYEETDIPTNRPGNHTIIPYGAEVGDNYRIRYVKGILAVGTLGSMDLAEAEIIFDELIIDDGQQRYYPVEPVVRYRDWTLRRGVDYTLSLSPGYQMTSYGGVIGAYGTGEFTIKVTGAGYYSGVKEKKFLIAKRNSDEPVIHPEYGEVRVEDVPADGVIPEGLWIAGLSEEGYYYTGQAVKPEVRVYNHKTLLREKTDYTVSYARNVNVNQVSATGVADDDTTAGKTLPTITVTGKGNYSSKAQKYFNILPVDFSEGGNVEALEITVAYTGKAQKPAPSLIWLLNGKTLKKNKDYTIAYHNQAGDSEQLDSVKEAGSYAIELIGRGNFTGSYWCSLTVTDSLKLISKVKVGKIPNQQYNDGYGLEPAVTVKDGRTTLERDVHYSVEYLNNTEVGTASAIIRGIEAQGYSGTKRVNFKITGTPIKKAKVQGLTSFIYSGSDIKPELQLTITEKVNGEQNTKDLSLDTDYTVAWQKNRNVGTATAVITGMGGYTGTMKKTFKIKPYNIAEEWDENISIAFTQSEVPYAKGGAKPKPAVRFWNEDRSIQTLVEGKDYTLSYKRHTIVTKGTDEPASVTIKGKGNFSGTYATVLTYEVVPQNIANLTLTAQDKTYQNKKNIYATKVVITDLDGKTLKAGKDYDKALTYTYQNETTVNTAEGTAVRAAGDTVDKNDIIPEGTVLQVKAKAKDGSNYLGEITGAYRITKASIASASVSVARQTYTGEAIRLDKSQITVKVKGQKLDDTAYEIVEDSYQNN